MQIGRVAGIPVFLHWSFLTLMVGYASVSWWRGGVWDLALTLAICAALFGSVLLHEFGHAMAARYYGIRTAHISLYPFGGVAAMEGMPGDPPKEMVVAFAGPAVNFVLATVSGIAFGLSGWSPFGWMAFLNGLMGVFNLLPAFPMDGGRVLRALLTLRLGFVAGSRLAIAIGRAFAVLFLLGGIGFGVWNVALVGAFLLFAVQVERRRLDQMVAHERAWRSGLPATLKSAFVVRRIESHRTR